MRLTLNEEFKGKSESYFIVLVILLYLFRTSIPITKFIFIPLFGVLTIYLYTQYKTFLRKQINEYLHNYYLLIFLAALLIISFLASNKIYLIIFKDVINSLVLLTFLFILSLAVNSKAKLDEFIRYFLKLIILFALIISISRIFELFNIFSNTKEVYINQLENNTDYNFAILPIFYGLLIVLYKMRRKNSVRKKNLYTILLTIFSISVFFSGSRRGLFVFAIIIILLLIAQFYSFLSGDSFFKQIGKNTRYFLLTIVLVIISLYYLIFQTSYEFKNDALKFIGSKNITKTKDLIAATIFRYELVINQNSNYSDLYNKIWTPIFDAKDPDSGWGSKWHTTIFPLTGDSVEIVPKGVRGYLLDRLSNADTANGCAYSASWISYHTVTDDDIIQASVYCYVSTDCDLSTVQICALGSTGNPGAVYNFHNKGRWQKLEFSANCSKGNASVLLYISKPGVPDFSLLKGYVIFAYPQIEVVKKNHNSPSYSPTKVAFGAIENHHSCEAVSYSKIRYYNNINRNIIDSLSEKSLLSRMPCSSIDNELVSIEDCKYTPLYSNSERKLLGLFSLNETYKLLLNSYQPDNDPVRKWTSRFISEDTTYFKFSSNLKVNEFSNFFIGSRTVRWQFALQIFTKEFNWTQKIFGGGFNFLNWYGDVFLNNNKLSDYPHNPLLTILLYSGIIGLCLYVSMLFLTFKYYIKYFNEYYIFFIIFIVTFFFSFFSAGSPFDPPIMGFFMILPFFIHHVAKRESKEKHN
jgi:O-antigen ligase